MKTTGNPGRINMNTNIGFTFILLLHVILCLYFTSCNLQKTVSNSNLGESFFKIYDKTDTINYTSIDVKQTAEGKYIILGTFDKYPYLLKVDERGDFLWDSANINGLKNYLEPIPNLLIINDAYYFFCKKIAEPGRIISLIKVEQENENFENELDICFENIYKNRGYTLYTVKPVHASVIDVYNYLLMSTNNWGDILTDPGERNTDLEWTQKNVVHYNGNSCLVSYPASDRKFHYTGKLKNTGKYYYQTFPKAGYPFKEYCIKIKMEDLDGNGFRPEFILDQPLVAMEWDDSQLDNNNLKLSGAFVKNNIVHFFVNIDIKIDKEAQNQQQQIKLEEKHSQPELLETKPVYITNAAVNGQEIIFFVGTTRADKVVLYAYSFKKDMFLGKRYFGDIRLYEASGLINTDDQGLAILGITYVIDFYKRICLFKLSKTELEEMSQ